MQGFLQPQSSPTLTLVTGFNKPPYVVIHSTPLISSAQMVECRFHSPMSSYLIMTRNHNPFSLRSKSDNSPWGIFSLSAMFKQYPIPYKETESLTSECAELLIRYLRGSAGTLKVLAQLSVALLFVFRSNEIDPRKFRIPSTVVLCMQSINHCIEKVVGVLLFLIHYSFPPS